MTSMFAVLTEEENNALYMEIRQGVRAIDKLWADRNAHGCYDNQDLESMSLDALEIMAELNSAPYAKEAKPEVKTHPGSNVPVQHSDEATCWLLDVHKYGIVVANELHLEW